MRIHVIKSGKEYQASIPAPDPDTEQVMYLIEKIIGMMELPKEEARRHRMVTFPLIRFPLPSALSQPL